MSYMELEPQAQQEIPPGAAAPATALALDTGAAAPVAALAFDGAAFAPDAGALALAPAVNGDAAEAPTPCTQAQLRRFIKSRPYVPLHELRRRFGLNGADDDVSGVDVDGHRIFIGLPERETGLLGELLRQGDVGYELLLDPTSPIVIGVFPMRPVQRL